MWATAITWLAMTGTAERACDRPVTGSVLICTALKAVAGVRVDEAEIGDGENADGALERS